MRREIVNQLIADCYRNKSDLAGNSFNYFTRFYAALKYAGENDTAVVGLKTRTLAGSMLASLSIRPEKVFVEGFVFDTCKGVILEALPLQTTQEFSYENAIEMAIQFNKSCYMFEETRIWVTAMEGTRDMPDNAVKIDPPYFGPINEICYLWGRRPIPKNGDMVERRYFPAAPSMAMLHSVKTGDQCKFQFWRLDDAPDADAFIPMLVSRDPNGISAWGETPPAYLGVGVSLGERVVTVQ